MEDYKRKYSEVSERLMERNRQYQKLQGLYDSLRLRNMVVGVGERDTLSQPGHFDFNTGKVFFVQEIKCYFTMVDMNVDWKKPLLTMFTFFKMSSYEQAFIIKYLFIK